MSEYGTSERLERLDARSWAQLLRSLRRSAPADEKLAALLARTTSELSDGEVRRLLCTTIAGSPAVLARLRDDQALPAAVLVAVAEAEHDSEGNAVASTELGAVPAEEPAEAVGRRARELRRTLEDERRRRDGAEARAATAEARAAEAIERGDQLQILLEEAQEELRASQEAVAQAAARAERRSGSRVASLERELASERREHQALRREHDRALAELASARGELDELRERHVDGRIGSVPSGPASRPLVLPVTIEEGTTEAARWLAERAGILLIDGYNVALTLRPGRSLEEQRRWLTERVRPLVARGRATPVIVFDGAGPSGRARDAGGVEVRFTVEGSSADDEIVFAVAATEDPVLVVTDDAELRERVRAEGGNVVGIVHLAGIVDA